MKKKIIIVVFLLLSSFIYTYELGEEKTKELSLTIYNGNFGLVKEKRIAEIPKDERYIIYKDVAELIEADSVIVDGLEIIELNYEYDLVSKKKLLEKYIGEKIYICDKELSRKKAYRLLSVYDGIVVEDLETKEVLIDPEGEMVLPKIIDGLKLKPSLVWKIKKGSARDKIGISYITKGLNWEAKYVVNIKEKVLDLVAWVDIKNVSGKDYKNANLKLVAGELNRVKEIQRPERRIMKSMSLEYDNVGFKEKEFFDYHMYSLAGKVNLKDNQSKQMELMKAENVKYKKYYTIENGAENANIIVKIENTKENMLGVALPKGTVKLYKEDIEDKNLEFVGEDNINHTPKDEFLRLNTGKAFDIKSEYKELSNKKTGKNSYEIEVEYKIENHKNEKAEIELVHNLYGDWEIIKANENYIKENSNKIVFNFIMDKDEEKTVKFNYSVIY